MAILKIARMGHPILRIRADEVVDPTAKEIRILLQDMGETLLDSFGAGLAAPQVHISKRVMIFEAPRERTDDEDAPENAFAPMTELINPAWEPLSDETDIGWEGCLSVPGLTGAVVRHTSIHYWGITPKGEKVDREAVGFHARIFQHEFDHLEGILYPMRMHDLSLLVFSEEVRRLGLPVINELPKENEKDQNQPT